MSLLTEHVSDQKHTTIGTVLVIGAGTGAKLPLWRSLDPHRLVLVEPHPENFGQISQRLDATRSEEAWPQAIVPDETSEATLHVVNNSLYSSLKPPHGLDRFYPNLRETSQETVPTRTLQELIQSLSLPELQTHLLVLDAPGIAHQLLEATPQELLQTFTWIEWHDTIEPLYQEARSAKDTADILHKAGFDQEHEDQTTISPEVVSLWKRNDTRISLTQTRTLMAERDRLLAQLSSLKNERDQQSRQITDLATQRDQANTEHKTQVGELQARIDALLKECDQHAKLANERKAELDKLNDEHKKQADDLQARVETLAKERDRHAKLANERKAELDKLNDEHKKQADDLQARVETLAKERDQLIKLADERKALLEKASQQSQERGARIIQLEKEHAELSRHQQQLDQEMVKAEAQVDLIKDVLLRDLAL